jgi:hypothetical protein
MYELQSTIENKVFPFQQIKIELEKAGYSLNGAWEYDHGYFDYKLANEDGYHFLRVPFHAINGDIDSDEAIIKMYTPYLLTHQYQNNVDAYAESSVMQAAFNQFQSPTDKDADIPSQYVTKGKQVLSELEVLLNNIPSK